MFKSQFWGGDKLKEQDFKRLDEKSTPEDYVATGLLIPTSADFDQMVRQPAIEVGHITDDIRAYVKMLREFCSKQPVAGIAAPQFGIPLRIAVLQEETRQIVMINPEVLKRRGEWTNYEGCMSLPGLMFYVKRPKKILVAYTTELWERKTIRGHDMTAAALDHELDHLDGTLIDTKGKLRP